MKNKALFLLLLAGLASACHLRTSKDKDDSNDDQDDTTSTVIGKVIPSPGDGLYHADYSAGTKAAQLNFDGVALECNLGTTTDKLFDAIEKNDPRKFVLSEEKTDSLDVLYFTMKEHHSHDVDIKDALLNLSLNPNPQWDINAKTAASQTNFDLTKFKIRHLKIKLAAGEFDVKLAPVLENTNVNIQIAAGTVKISIPQDAACELDIESSFADSDFPGFQKKDDGHYETPNFAAAKNKIHIKAEYSLAEFKVERY